MENTPKLQILIPQYKETDEVIKPLLDSIANQQRVDLEHDISVIIVNDGSDTHLNTAFLNEYLFRIDYILAPHEGVSATRNRLLDHAKADYIMWCDADDMFYISHAFWLIMRDIKNGPFDVLNSVFLEEVFTRGGDLHDLIKHENDRTFVHGKVYRRQYLIDKNIRWNTNLSIHEDVYFTTLAMMETKEIRYQDTFFYVWKYHEDSICRKDPKYALKTYVNLIDSNDALVDELEKRGNMTNAQFITSFVTYDLYYTLQLPLWHEEENVEFRNTTEKRFGDFWKKHKQLYLDAPWEQKKKTANAIRGRMTGCGMGFEFIALGEWLNYIEGLNEE